MTEKYIIADNLFTVTVPDDFRPWIFLKKRYRPFLASTDNSSVLSIQIQTGDFPQANGTRIYEPEYLGIGIISARASQLDDDSLLMEFLHVDDSTIRLQMKMTTTMDTAEILMHPDSDKDDPLFLTHAIMLAYLLSNSRKGTVLIHSSCIVYEGKAYLFQGKSGTGKSTHAKLWVENIKGAELLNDDHPVIHISGDGTPIVFGSPWSGKTHCYKNVEAPIGAFVRIVKSQENELKRLVPLQSYASLTTSVFYLPIFNEEQKEARHKTIERLAMTVPCCEMHCRPDADAALTCQEGVKRLVVNGG